MFTGKILCLLFSVIIFQSTCVGALRAYTEEHCRAGEDCQGVTLSRLGGPRYLFYDVNPGEGFNLRRDVYMRLAIFMRNLCKNPSYQDYLLVLPPFSNLRHWEHNNHGDQKNLPWKRFFDVQSFKLFVSVVELHEVFQHEKNIIFDHIYNLRNYPDPFINGVFEDKWEIKSDEPCPVTSNFWGYSNITYKSNECILFQGYTKMLKELIEHSPSDKMILITNAQIPLHDEYGTRKYWRSRRSMKFNSTLVNIAERFVAKTLKCTKKRCDNYVAIHLRRGDFAKYRKDVPSIKGAIDQVVKVFMERYNMDIINTVYLSTDSSVEEFKAIIHGFMTADIKVEWFVGSRDIRRKITDGGIAIVDQIICSHAAYFIGSYESTFTFRIQEEREILQFDSNTTFNRFCPDTGECENSYKWQMKL